MITSKTGTLACSLAALLLSAAALTLVATGCCGRDQAPPTAPSDVSRELFGQSSQSGYSAAARYGDLVWTAGHLPPEPSRGDAISRQTDEVLKALKRTLEQAGANFDTVVMTNVFLADFDDWDAFNTVYRQHFTRGLPPRVTVQVGRLAFGKIEISMLAHVKQAAPAQR